VPYLIDGDNLLGTWPGRSRSDPDKRRLSAELQRVARAWRRRVIVVYDGPEPPVPHPSNDVLFSGARRADDVILDRLRRENDARGWIVVTSDRSLADQCRYMGARVERADRFRPRLRARGPGEEKPDGPVDVDDWEAWFRERGDGEPD
jgi:hypothetical protein